MPRLDSKELAAARRRKQQEREAQQMEEKAKATAGRDRLLHLRELRDKAQQLESVLGGHYEEMDKLAKKSPSDQVTELQMNRVNSLVKQCKQIMVGDEFIDSIEVFVAAGECPENRDVLFVLRELKQGLKRLDAEARALEEQAKKERWPEAKFGY